MKNKITTLSIVIPAYNEQSRLERCFSTLNAWTVPAGIKVEKIIFVNDGSKDKTLKLLRQSELKFSRKVISYKTNQGKGHAVRTGMQTSTSDYTLLMDADMATAPDQLERFLPFIEKNTDLIIGTRKNGHSTVTVHQPWIRENMGKVFTKLSQIILCVNVTDFTCGFKAFSRRSREYIFSRARINRWGYDSEVLFLGSHMGFSITEKSVAWADQKDTKVNLLKDALDSFKELLQIRNNYFLGVYNAEMPKSSLASYTYS